MPSSVCSGTGARWERLPEKLRQTALLRLQYPEMSLSQLAEKCDPPVTKSCMNHRMRKLLEEAKKLMMTKEERCRLALGYHRQHYNCGAERAGGLPGPDGSDGGAVLGPWQRSRQRDALRRHLRRRVRRRAGAGPAASLHGTGGAGGPAALRGAGQRSSSAASPSSFTC